MATAAAPASTAATARKRVVTKEHEIPMSAKIPAKLSPHDKGMTLANAIPMKLNILVGVSAAVLISLLLDRSRSPAHV